MNRSRWTIICLSYLVGLLFTGVLGFPNLNPSWLQWGIILIGISSLSLILAVFIAKRWRTAPRGKFWLGAAIVAFLAVVYFQLRVPYPSKNDISQLLKGSRSQAVIVEGKVKTESRLNASQRLSFWFEVNSVTKNLTPQPPSLQGKGENTKIAKKYPNQVIGKLYVTAPLLKDKKYYRGQLLTIEGILYKPSSAANPGAFDFKNYLAREGAFAGLKGQQIIKEGEPPWGFWILRKRIVNSQGRWLGSPIGELFSSISIGQKAVDLPEEIRTLFNRAGLAHILAASGFQVVLLLGVVIFFTRKFSPEKQLFIGVGALIFYVGLTGIQPSVCRAALMGFGGLIGLVLNRKVNRLGSLLFVATLLLLFNPLWIWDLGFQLSFLATFSLIVTVQPLEQKLDFLPPTISTIIAIPIGVSVWTLPLLMHSFSVVATYSILCNIITAPLVTIISLGGMLSAGVGLLFPLGGSAIAWLFYYPTLFLIAIAKFFVYLPGSSYAVGKLSVGVMVLIYAVLLGIWLNRWCQQYWKVLSLFLLTVVVVPIIITRLSLVQVTVLDTKPHLSIVIQERGKVAVINGGDDRAEKYSIVPFLTVQGVNQVDRLIAFDNQKSTLASFLAVKEIVNKDQLLKENNISLGKVEIEVLNIMPTILQFTVAEQKWLWLTQASKPPDDKSIESVNVLLWSGKRLNYEWIEAIKPETVIAVSSFVEAKTRRVLQHEGIKLYWTGKDGAIQWTPQGGFQTNMITENPDI